MIYNNKTFLWFKYEKINYHPHFARESIMNHASSFSQMRTDCSIPRLSVLVLWFPEMCCSNVSFMYSFPYNYSVSCELQTQIWLNEYIIHADRLNTVPESSRCVYVTFYCHSSTRWFGRLNSSLSDKLCESTMQIGQTPQSVSHWLIFHT